MNSTVSAVYVADISMRNRLKALHRPTVGILSGKNAPVIKSNDKKQDAFWRKAKQLQLKVHIKS